MRLVVLAAGQHGCSGNDDTGKLLSGLLRHRVVGAAWEHWA